MVSIEIPDLEIKASVNDGVWACNDDLFMPLLESVPMLRQKYYYDPDPDYTKAKAIIDEFGGRITHHDKQDYDPDVIY